MMFNPCSPCCAIAVLSFDFQYDMSGYQPIYDPGNPDPIYQGTLANFYRAAGYNVVNLFTENTNLIIAQGVPFGSGIAQYLDWFNRGNKRLVLMPSSWRGYPYAGGSSLADNYNAVYASYRAIYDNFFALAGSTIRAIDNQPPVSGLCDTANFVGTHYLKAGLSTIDQSNSYQDCRCWPAQPPWTGSNARYESGVQQLSGGTPLTTLFGDVTAAVEKIGTSELIVYGDPYGMWLPRTFTPANYYPFARCNDLPYEPVCAAAGVEGCAFSTPQFLLNLASLPIQ